MRFLKVPSNRFIPNSLVLTAGSTPVFAGRTVGTLARLRNRKFFSLIELNRAIALLLVDLHQRAFKKLPGCRRSAFEQLYAPALRPLPATRFEIFRWKSARVNINYRVSDCQGCSRRARLETDFSVAIGHVFAPSFGSKCVASGTPA